VIYFEDSCNCADVELRPAGFELKEFAVEAEAVQSFQIGIGLANMTEKRYFSVHLNGRHITYISD